MCSGAMYKVDIPPNTRDDIHNKLKETSVHPSLFDVAQKHVHQVLYSDVCPKFMGKGVTYRLMCCMHVC